MNTKIINVILASVIFAFVSCDSSNNLETFSEIEISEEEIINSEIAEAADFMLASAYQCFNKETKKVDRQKFLEITKNYDGLKVYNEKMYKLMHGANVRSDDDCEIADFYALLSPEAYSLLNELVMCEDESFLSDYKERCKAFEGTDKEILQIVGNSVDIILDKMLSIGITTRGSLACEFAVTLCMECAAWAWTAMFTGYGALIYIASNVATIYVSHYTC